METERVRGNPTRVRLRSSAAPGRPVVALLGSLALGVVLLSPGPALLASMPGAAPTHGEVTESQDALADPGGSVGNSPLSLAEIKSRFKSEAEKPRFDGSIAGWRMATYRVLLDAGMTGRGLNRSCQAYEAGVETPTQLDFAVGYLPRDVKVVSVSEPVKWLCGTDGLSVAQVYDIDTRLGVGHIWIERSIQAVRSIEVDVAADRVRGATISGFPAILVHPLDDATGLGLGRVIVIEDDTGPEFEILSITADNGVPFADLVKMAEGIK